MLKTFVALLALALTPTAVFALPDNSAQAAPYTVSNATLDTLTRTIPPGKPNKDITVLGYAVSFHDTQSQYTLPLCADAAFAEVDGRTVDLTSLTAGDIIVVSVRANTSAVKSCASRVVRQTATRGPSGGECLQNFQVKREIAGDPSRLYIQTEYTYALTIYNRPTVDCDGKAYGAKPILTTVAAGKPFVVTVQRGTSGDAAQLSRWSLNTDSAGRASFTYTFNLAADTYKFQLVPAGTTAAGDALSWTAQVLDPSPTATTAPVTPAPAFQVTALPLLILLIVVLLGASGGEYWHWVKRKRSHELPEREYERTSKF
jgi:hypothetical protein